MSKLRAYTANDLTEMNGRDVQGLRGTSTASAGLGLVASKDVGALNCHFLAANGYYKKPQNCEKSTGDQLLRFGVLLG